MVYCGTIQKNLDSFLKRFPDKIYKNQKVTIKMYLSLSTTVLFLEKFGYTSRNFA